MADKIDAIQALDETLAKFVPAKVRNDLAPTTFIGVIEAFEADIKRLQERHDEDLKRLQSHLLDALRIVGHVT